MYIEIIFSFNVCCTHVYQSIDSPFDGICIVVKNQNHLSNLNLLLNDYWIEKDTNIHAHNWICLIQWTQSLHSDLLDVIKSLTDAIK
jgi:hypothetical protein